MWLSCFGPEPAGGSWSWWELASAHRVASQTLDPQGVASTATCSSITSHTQRPFLNLTFSFTIPNRFSHWPRSCTLGTISLMSPTTSFDCSMTRSCFCGSTHRTSMGSRERLVFLPQSWLKLMGPLHQLRAQSVEGPSRGRTSGGIRVHHGGDTWQQAADMAARIGSSELTSSNSSRKQREQSGSRTDVMADRVPHCSVCTGVVKPDIVFFGESLPARFLLHVADFPMADLLLILGTSLEVEPFASLSEAVQKSVPRLLINRDLVGPFAWSPRSKDVAQLGDVVESVERLVDLLGWTQELQDLIQRETGKLDGQDR
ncbi:NAD-dependent protein deacetylase sirtuin-3, mitochondrial isoform X1 [Microtus oregoni]|uniref:NAD-dependent protein deacetylase sirtuin-3, mitochondrial isoform X1 n=1 Tax=Microtus oregoni TaxID=111838 RepID=UPI001BB17D4F|nr:NAD-dependent protein deacetylase sirtuin-3, mitochondrial isoform X1 [Microtus oregoni]XP_041523221.1 NAD-dependent protein deacetylase sirtuin-3, mitochondrial isoform X1 [Microtus oregoni]